jgi:hypothetical protein
MSPELHIERQVKVDYNVLFKSFSQVTNRLALAIRLLSARKLLTKRKKYGINKLWFMIF